jgi:predicted CoA-binding protein
MRKEMEEFFKAEAFGVVGASSDRSKYGNRVLRCYQEHSLRAIPVNPKEKAIEGEKCVSSVADLPTEVTSISVVTPPAVTEKVVEEAARKGIKNIWMQPGAESDAAISLCRERGINVIGDGSCILIVLGFSEH